MQTYRRPNANEVRLSAARLPCASPPLQLARDGACGCRHARGTRDVSLMSARASPPPSSQPLPPFQPLAVLPPPTNTQWIVQGHTYDDYMQELLPNHTNPMHVIPTLSNLDRTMMRASINTRDFLINLT